jgi:hypothetical protein
LRTEHAPASDQCRNYSVLNGGTSLLYSGHFAAEKSGEHLRSQTDRLDCAENTWARVGAFEQYAQLHHLSSTAVGSDAMETIRTSASDLQLTPVRIGGSGSILGELDLVSTRAKSLNLGQIKTDASEVSLPRTEIEEVHPQ